MSICAPAWVPPLPQKTVAKLSWHPVLLICGAKPKWTPRFMPASLPRASNVAKAGSNPVRTLLLAASPAAVFSFVNTQDVHVSGERERPPVRHLHRELSVGRRGPEQRHSHQQQRETLHTRFPPWEFTCSHPTARASRGAD